MHRPVLGYSEEEVAIVEDNQVDHQLMGERGEWIVSYILFIYYHYLEASLTEDHLPHGAGDESIVLAIGLPLQECLCGGFGCKSESCHRVHDQVHPQQLHGLQRAFAMIFTERNAKIRSLSIYTMMIKKVCYHW